MNYNKYHEQTLTAYKNVRYGGNSIYNSACGPATLANALMVLGIADITVKDACAFAVSCKARVEGGTDMHKLLAAAAKKWKITYTTTSSNAKLAAHLRAGGVAVMNQGSKHKVFSNGGHFVLAAAIDSADCVTVIDSYWNTKKYKTWPAYHAKSKVLSRCFVRTPLEWCGKATIDRAPSYYLISKKVAQKPANSTTTINKKQEDDDMTYYKKFENIPTWYQTAVKKAMDAGALKGTGNGELNVSEDLCRTLTVLNNMGVLDKK
ncbi:hypothetical protein [Butyricicoccus sp.]|uniref:hypothetical protein n=1 Tax=Butyricicoccus sp. TaxID=2049021 RepID=UPI003D7E4D15